MSQWPSKKAKLVLAALLKQGWSIKRQTGSHRTLHDPVGQTSPSLSTMAKKSDRECWRGWPNTLGLNRKTFKGWPKLDFNLVAWSPNTDKGAVASIRKWLEQHGVDHEHDDS